MTKITIIIVVWLWSSTPGQLNRVEQRADAPPGATLEDCSTIGVDVAIRSVQRALEDRFAVMQAWCVEEVES